MTKGHRQRIIKDFCRETLLWRQLRHPNILPFLGFNEELFTPSFCLISPLLVNGNVRSFLESNPHHDRLKVLLDIAKGIGYLHEYHPPIIHGDIRGANVLVKDNLECCLGDLGLSLIAESGGLDTTSRNTQGGACRWMAPELLNSEFSLPNPDRRKRDIYAFGCTCLEICANEAPFSTQPLDYMVCLDVMQGRRPPRPSRDQVSDQLWSLIESCWLDTPLSRPDINLVLSRLRTKRPKPHSSDEKETSNPIASGNPSHSGQGPEDDTNSVVVSDRLWVQSALPLHVSRSDIPDCHRQKAELGAFGEPAVLNSPMRDQLLLFLRERAKRWMQVRHQNVIEVLGIDESSNAPKVFMITDATYFDNILSFNYANPHERTVKRLHENLMDIANGLHALHQHGIVHADLRCVSSSISPQQIFDIIL
ncbi:kinase-like domain-containing protein [Flagelloscypha sp. PMI_526]|nr:kinase-like domain-containing protein [Flagelloscypha sp. PMI_526]